jgi:histidinol dehydrogenase
MPSLKIRRIDTSNPHAARQLAALQNPFADQAHVVSGSSRKLTQAVFGEALPPVKAVEKICNDVKNKGLSALLHYTEAFDKVRLTPKQIRVPADELAAAFEQADPAFIDTARRIRENVLQFQVGLMSKDALLPVSEHFELQLRYRPLKRVGVCIPGGAAAYPSTLLMTVCPAQAAEVKEIVVVMPPTANGAQNRDMLAICHLLGVKEVYRIGGARRSPRWHMGSMGSRRST